MRHSNKFLSALVAGSYSMRRQLCPSERGPLKTFRCGPLYVAVAATSVLLLLLSFSSAANGLFNHNKQDAARDELSASDKGPGATTPRKNEQNDEKDSFNAANTKNDEFPPCYQLVPAAQNPRATMFEIVADVLPYRFHAEWNLSCHKFEEQFPKDSIASALPRSANENGEGVSSASDGLGQTQSKSLPPPTCDVSFCNASANETTTNQQKGEGHDHQADATLPPRSFERNHLPRKSTSGFSAPGVQSDTSIASSAAPDGEKSHRCAMLNFIHGPPFGLHGIVSEAPSPAAWWKAHKEQLERLHVYDIVVVAVPRLKAALFGMTDIRLQASHIAAMLTPTVKSLRADGLCTQGVDLHIYATGTGALFTRAMLTLDQRVWRLRIWSLRKGQGVPRIYDKF
eukprot:GHVT01097580.1.p1 GENE.GHVT01097580.1~~GHVT01097580.1.p1  ORF type:complete len:399 (-),score=43.17 GHVT01097580.1:1604-2800(-)